MMRTTGELVSEVDLGRGRISGRGLMLLPRTTRRREKNCTIVTIMLVTQRANESDVHKKVLDCWL
jgi:hypothetical protein